MSDKPTEVLRECAFCGRSEAEVSFLIPARDGKTYICDSCIELCSDFIEEHLSTLDAELIDDNNNRKVSTRGNGNSQLGYFNPKIACARHFIAHSIVFFALLPVFKLNNQLNFLFV